MTQILQRLKLNNDDKRQTILFLSDINKRIILQELNKTYLLPNWAKLCLVVLWELVFPNSFPVVFVVFGLRPHLL